MVLHIVPNCERSHIPAASCPNLSGTKAACACRSRFTPPFASLQSANQMHAARNRTATRNMSFAAEDLGKLPGFPARAYGRHLEWQAGW